MKQIAQIEKSFMKEDYPRFSSGDTVRVHYRIKEGEKERIQVFQGIVIGRRGSGTGASFTVRKISSGIGVERVFPLYSPNIAKIDKIRTGKVRRNKLYYLRDLTGKSARIKELLAENKGENSNAASGDETYDEKPKVPEAIAEASETSTEAKVEDQE